MNLPASTLNPTAEAQTPNTTAWREQLLTAILRMSSLIGLVALVIAGAREASLGHWLVIGVFILAYLFAMSLTVLTSLPYWFRANALLVIGYIVSLSSLLSHGLSGNGLTILFAFNLIALMLLGIRGAVITLGVSFVTLVVVGWSYVTQRYSLPIEIQANSADAESWAAGIAVYVLMSAMIVAAIYLLQRNYVVTLEREHHARAELQREREQLEQRVVERTRTIERRTMQVAASADIARVATTELDPDKLLDQVANLIYDRFDLYYVGIFLVDDAERFAVLRAGTGEAGKAMLATQHRLEIGGQSMIGRSISEHQARIALDVGQEAVRFNNPHLPLTRSEMALPLAARDRIIGALTIQSSEPEAFSPEDILSLQGMADLIGVAIDNGRLFQETQHALNEMTAVHQNYISQAWSAFARAHAEAEGQVPTYIYTGKSLERDDSTRLPGLVKALDQQKMVISSGENDSTITVPIKLRDEIIGALAIESDSPDRVWEPADLAMIESIVEQTALSLENARLIEEAETALAETRRLAAREQTVNVISTKLRRLPSVESVLTTALVELGRSLGASQGQVHLGLSTKRTPPGEVAHE